MKGKEMKLILNVSSHNENDDGGCVLALVDLIPRLAELALRRIATVCAIRAEDGSAEEIYYWNYDVLFFDPFMGVEGDRVGNSILEGPQPASGEELLERLSRSPNDFVELDAAIEIPESGIARIDCSQMAVRSDGIAFVAIPKHASFYVETCELPTEILRRAADSI